MAERPELAGPAAFPGVGPGAFGLAGQPAAFVELAGRANAALGLPSLRLVSDYWLTACLAGIAAAAGPDGVIHRGQGRKQTPLARCVFAGGTSLVSAWGITERFSEDLDILALVIDQEPSASALKRPLSVVTRWAAAAIGLDDEDVTVAQMSNVGFRRTHLRIGGDPRFLKIETTVEADSDGLCVARQITSLLGRFATADELGRHPELGGFEMLCVTPAYTAANKFDALHRRAAAGDLRGLAQRGRDLYDLAAIAASDHADAARSAIPVLAERSAASSGRRDSVPRPRRGYATSILFTPGAEAHEALRDGYRAVADLTWGSLPSYETALDLAASLDAPS